jgi:hypothetical protein
MINTGFATNILYRARKTNYNMKLTAEEVEFVLTNDALSTTAKMLWLTIACSTARDRQLTCTIDIQLLTGIFPFTSCEIAAALQCLKENNFLQIGCNIPPGIFQRMPDARDYEKINSLHCTLMLPNAGLKTLLKNAPSVQKKGDKRPRPAYMDYVEESMLQNIFDRNKDYEKNERSYG